MNNAALELYPENPTTFLVAAVTHENTVTQTMNDGEVSALAALAGKLKITSDLNHYISTDNMVAQVADENAADVSVISGDETGVKRHDRAAQAHHVKSGSAAVIAENTDAAANTAKEASKIRIAVLKVAQCQERGTKEVEDRTQACTKQDIDRARAAATDHDQEEKLALLAKPNPATAPKMG